MADASVAPKERVNIVYKSTIGDRTEEVELPLKLLMVGDYTGRRSDEVIEERPTVNVNKDNFDEVMKGFNLSMNLVVNNKLAEVPGAPEELPISLSFKSMKDFSPDSLVQQVPELNSLLELRRALLALKGPLGNVPAFRKAIQGILSDDQSRAQIMRELGLGDA